MEDTVLSDTLAHYGKYLIDYGFAAVVAAVIVMIIHRAFQPLLLSLLDELRESAGLFREILRKKESERTEGEQRLLGSLAIAYAVVSGLFFVGIMMLLGNLATPVG